MKQQISTATAERVWKALQEHYAQGGFMVFDQDGNHGKWHYEDTRPEIGDTDIAFACPDADDDLTTLDECSERAQRWVAACKAVDPDDRFDDLEQGILERQEHLAGF